MSSTSTATATSHEALQILKFHNCSSFLAGEELIDMVPLFTYAKPLRLLGYTDTNASIGPFTAGVTTQVPLWMALYLVQRKMARIVPPDWLDEAHLKEVLREEGESDSFSPQLPPHYQSMARSILAALHQQNESVAPSIAILLQDVETLRLDKIRQQLFVLSRETLPQAATLPIITTHHMGSLERQFLRPFLQQVLEDHTALARKTQPPQDQPKTPTSARRRKTTTEEATAGTTATATKSRLRRFR